MAMSSFPDLASTPDPAAAEFTALCRLACALLSVPVAALVLPDGRGTWIAHDGACSPQEEAFATGRTGWQEETAIELWLGDGSDPACPPGVRFRASIACDAQARLRILDPRPRRLDPEDIGRLRDLAAVAGAGLRVRDAAQAISERAAYFRLLTESAADTIVHGDLDGRRMYVSPAVRGLLGYEPQDMLGLQAMDIVHPDDLERFRDTMRQVREGRFEVGEVEVRQRHRNGTWVWMEASLRLIRDGETGQPTGYIASVREIGRRKALEEQLAHRAFHDALTGLPNRSLLHCHLGMLLGRMRAHAGPLALFYIDIDHFKQVNDSFGHRIGDAVLCETAARLREAASGHGVAARMGGDEFAMALSFGPDEAAQAGARLLDAFRVPVIAGATSLDVGISIGIACAPESGKDANALLAAADRALYAAKQAGRRQFRFAPPIAQVADTQG